MSINPQATVIFFFKSILSRKNWRGVWLFKFVNATSHVTALS